MALALAAANVASAAEPDVCDAPRAALRDARERLRDCLSSGGGCAAERKAVDDAVLALGDCPEYPPATPTPTAIPFRTPEPIATSAPIETPAPIATPAPISTPLPIATPARFAGTAAPRTPVDPWTLFGDVGTKEVGGGFSAYSRREHSQFDGGSPFSVTSSRVQFSIFAGIFVSQDAELVLGGSASGFGESFNDHSGDRSRFFSGDLGFAWYPPVTSRLRLGPEVTVGFFEQSFRQNDGAGTIYLQHTNGPIGSAFLVAKVPVGGQVLLRADAGWFAESYSMHATEGSLSANGDGGIAAFETTVGLSYFFPAKQ